MKEAYTCHALPGRKGGQQLLPPLAKQQEEQESTRTAARRNARSFLPTSMATLTPCALGCYGASARVKSVPPAICSPLKFTRCTKRTPKTECEAGELRGPWELPVAHIQENKGGIPGPHPRHGSSLQTPERGSRAEETSWVTESYGMTKTRGNFSVTQKAGR